MDATVLDSRDDGIGTCYLCRIALEDYVNGLPTDYQDYDIQREIVANVYLDHLVETVLNKRHIPPIVLVAERASIKKKADLLINCEIKHGGRNCHEQRGLETTPQ